MFPAEQLHLLRYRELLDRPRETLDAICRFLAVEPGHVLAAPAENVSTWVANTRLNALVRRVVGAGAGLGAHAPPRIWRAASTPLLRVLHRGGGNRPELDPVHRRRLVERLADDVHLLEAVTGESYQGWLAERGQETYSVRSSWAAPEIATS